MLKIDYKQLEQTIYNQIDLPLFHEVKKCIEVEAYRAAYIMCWIGIAESLKYKFKSMAFKDSKIFKIIDKINEMEEKNSATDQYIFDQATNILKMFPPDEIKRLEHIKNMRNTYAHPTSTAPTKIEALSALLTAHDLVWSRPPLMRKGYVSYIVNSLFGDKHFLDQHVETVEEFAYDVYGVLHSDSKPFLLREVVEKLNALKSQENDNLFRSRGTAFIRAFLSKEKENGLSNNWSIDDLIDKYSSTSAYIFSFPETWILLTQHQQDRVIGYLLERGEPQKPTELGINHMRLLHELLLLTERQEERFLSSIELADDYTLINNNIDIKHFVSRIITGLKSLNWYMQNHAIDLLVNTGAQQISSLENSTQIELGRCIYSAAVGNAKRAIDVIRFINTNGYPESILEGALYESLLNNENKFRVKKNYLMEVFQQVLELENREQIIERFTELIKTSEPKYRFLIEEYDDAVQVFLGIKVEENDPCKQAILSAIAMAKEKEARIIEAKGI